MKGKNRINAYRIGDALLRQTLRLIPYCSAAEQLALWWGYKFNPVPRAVRLRSGALIQLSHVDHLQLLLYYLGTFEPMALKAMKDHLRPGDTVLDVGANIGLFTIEAAKVVGPAGSVIAIEAMPGHAESLRKSAILNEMRGIEINSVAVGSAILTLPTGSNRGMFTLGKVVGDEKITVPVRRIDDIVGERRVDFLKMDIEGSEYQALLGARRMIERQRPKILIELNESALRAYGSSARQVKQLLFDFGYTGQIVGTASPVLLDQHHLCEECLFLAV